MRPQHEGQDPASVAYQTIDYAKQTGTEATLASQAVAHSTVCMLVTVPAMLLLTGVMFPM